MKLILIGIQGSGKSTQGNLLSRKLGLPYLSTGNIFREIAKEDTALGQKIKSVMNSGLLISDSQTIEIVTDYLSRAQYKNGYILDGFPRTIGQVNAFKNGIDKVIYLKISDKEALWRISGRGGEAREDETLMAVRQRIDSFHEFTEPVLEYFKDKGQLIEINGEQEVDKIQNEILAKLK